MVFICVLPRVGAPRDEYTRRCYDSYFGLYSISFFRGYSGGFPCWLVLRRVESDVSDLGMLIRLYLSVGLLLSRVVGEIIHLAVSVPIYNSVQ